LNVIGAKIKKNSPREIGDFKFEIKKDLEEKNLNNDPKNFFRQI